MDLPAMLPFSLAISFTNQMTSVLIDAQRASYTAGLASFEKVVRQHERPTDAAERAQESAELGETKSWYRKPPPSWFDVATSFTTLHPVFAGARTAPVSFASPAAPRSDAPITPVDAMLSIALALPQLMMANSATSVLSSEMVRPVMPVIANSSDEPSGPEAQHLEDVSPDATAVEIVGPAPAGRRELAKIELLEAPKDGQQMALASMTMPDNTILRITVPVAPTQTLFNPATMFWPFALFDNALPRPGTPRVAPNTEHTVSDKTDKADDKK